MCVASEWGLNLVSSNNEEWRRHRRVLGPAFNAATYSLVWAETQRAYRDMVITEDMSQKDVVTLKSVQAYTTRIAFLVISACGFGFKFKWEEPTEKEDGGMSVSEALRLWVDLVFVRILAPSWVYKLPFKRYTLQCYHA
jgi:cytochrome P450